MSLAARALVSEAEFLALPETTQRVELVDGEVVVAPSPSLRHQEVLARLVQALRGWARGRDASVVQAPMDVRFGPDRILQPDAMVFLQRLSLDVETPLAVIPELCIEVLSTNRAYDRVTKRFLYGEAGVSEYWLVEPSGLVERRTGSGLSSSEEVTGKLSSSLLPGFELDLSELT